MMKKERIDRRRARAWMVMEGVRPCDIKIALGQRSLAQAVETLTGVRSDKKVLNWLLNRGCPEEYLQLPKQMQGGK
jgi:hypothetical protein